MTITPTRAKKARHYMALLLERHMKRDIPPYIKNRNARHYRDVIALLDEVIDGKPPRIEGNGGGFECKCIQGQNNNNKEY